MNAHAAQACQTETRAPAEQFDDLAQQHDTAQMGMWVFLATEILFFGVLFASYTIGRILAPQGFVLGSGHTELPFGAAEAVILLVASAAVTWAVIMIEQVKTPCDADQRGLRNLVVRLLAFAALCGIAFLVLHGIEYWHEYEDQLIPGINFHQTGPFAKQIELFFFVYYALTLYHSLHVAIGSVLLVVLATMVQRGSIHRDYTTPLVVGGLYWHVVDIVWIFLFPLIYLINRT